MKTIIVAKENELIIKQWEKERVLDGMLAADMRNGVTYVDSFNKGIAYGLEEEDFAIISGRGGVRMTKAEAKTMAKEILEILEIYKGN